MHLVNVFILSSLKIFVGAFQQDAWCQLGTELALADSRRSFNETEVEEAGICHGGAGLVHLYNRMYQATGDERLKTTCKTWIQHTLDLWERQPLSDDGLLTGAAGVGLALLGTVSQTPPLWDRPLLLG